MRNKNYLNGLKYFFIFFYNINFDLCNERKEIGVN